MEQTRLYFIRHGQVVGHQERRFNGRTNVPLTDFGKNQLEAVAEDLAEVEFGAVYSSDLSRARFGGELLAAARGLTPRTSPAFREIDFGAWEGLNTPEIEARYPGELTKRFANLADHRIPGGETLREVWQRVSVGLDEIRTTQAGKNVALVAHSGVNRVILVQALGGQPDQIWRIDQDFGCLNIVDYYQDGVAVVRLANGPNRVTNGWSRPAFLPLAASVARTPGASTL